MLKDRRILVDTPPSRRYNQNQETGNTPRETDMNTTDIRTAITADLNTLGMGHVNINILWSSRYTTAFAKANIRRCTITFGTKTFTAMTPYQQRETVAHEVAHIVAFIKWGDASLRDSHHGWMWRAVMRDLGYANAKATLEIDALAAPAKVRSIQRAVKRHVATCKCGEHLMTTGQAKKTWICRKCQIKIVLTGEVRMITR